MEAFNNQSDRVPTSEVIPDFYNLQKRFREMKTMRLLSEYECEYLCFLVTTCQLFLHGKGHDPRQLGDERPKDERDHLEMMLSFTPTTTENLQGEHTLTRQGEEGVQGDSYDEVDARQMSLFVEYTRFVIKCTEDRNQLSFRYRILKHGEVTLLEWWHTDGRRWPLLQEIAVKLFSMVASSAASERNFSIMSFIHSKLRNRLNPATFEKLVFIKNNVEQDDCSDADDEIAKNSILIEDNRAKSDVSASNYFNNR